VKAVQTGIYYSPNINFYAFDIAFETHPNEELTYIDYNEALEIFHKVDLFCAEPLAITSYDEAIDFPIGFSSTLPARLKLPPLKSINKAEGIVVKPLKNIYLDSKKGKQRLIIKIKIPEFSEIKFNEAEKWSETKNSGISQFDIIKYEIQSLITENRLNNAISKLGKPSKSDKEGLKALLQLYYNDIIESLKETSAESWELLRSEEKSELQNFISLQAKLLILTYLNEHHEN